MFGAGVPNLGDARGLKSVMCWVQWGDAIVVRGDADTKRLGTLDLKQMPHTALKHLHSSRPGW